VDRQTLLVRRTIAGVAGLFVLVLLVLLVRGCLDQRQERAMKSYVRDVSTLVGESDQQSDALFRLLKGTGGRDQAVDVENSLNDLRVQSAQLVDRARRLDPPGDVDQAQDYLLESLQFRREGLGGIADNLPTALGDQDRRQGTQQVTAEMQNLLASDVIYLQRFRASLRQALKDDGLEREVTVPDSAFVPEIQWLQPSYVADRVSALRTGGGGEASPGLHGNGIGTVTLGGQTLSEGASTSVTLSGDLAFQVQVLNQGDNTETDVNVKATIGRGDDAIDVSETLDSIASGETKSVTIPLEERPPTGQNVPVVVEVEPVSGEEKTDNNKLTATVIFTS
jgi:hypothetical protein